SPRQQVALVVGAAAAGALVVGLVALAGTSGKGDEPPPPIRTAPHEAGVPVVPETRLVAPVVIAPPPAVDERLDAGPDAAPTTRPRPRSSGAR
ncbi:MAG: hypothetical protein JWP97_2691, partial [Labilithrix sp.]|nr:hypothetical protein [Labilithrix sp.]